jgi:hypothetical protein
LLLAFPDLKTEAGAVRARLLALGADAGALETWQEVVATDIEPAREEDEL